MIFETLFSVIVFLLDGLLSGISIITLPFDALKSLATVLCYGSWVLGADMLILFCGSLTFWVGVKASIGLVIFIWRLLPLT